MYYVVFWEEFIVYLGVNYEVKYFGIVNVFIKYENEVEGFYVKMRIVWIFLVCFFEIFVGYFEWINYVCCWFWKLLLILICINYVFIRFFLGCYLMFIKEFINKWILILILN